MDIYLPERLNKGTITRLLNQVVSLEGTALHDEYNFRFDGLRKFIEPIGVTFLHNLITWLNAQGKKVEFTYNDDKEILSVIREPQRFLDDCGFFEIHLEQKIYSDSKLRETTVPIKEVKTESFNQWLTSSFIPWVANSIGKSSQELETFKASLEEIFNNVRDHAQKESSCVFAQHIPGNNTVIISIADMGIGIINHIKKTDEYRHFTDEEALRSAIKNKFTTKSTPRNRGAGLDNLIHNVVMNANGVVYIYANKGILECRKENEELKTIYKTANHFYPGTHIDIQIDVDYAENLFDCEEEEFAWEGL